MRNFKLSAVKVLVAFAVITLCLSSVTALADELPEGVKQVWTAVEGNIIYYVKVGDKVKEGAPLFFVVSADNNPSLFFEIQHKVEYFRILYKRREKLIKTHAVSQEAVDNAFQNLINAKDQLALYLSQFKLGYYIAPFDCEITKLLYVQHSGIGDGNPAINIKPTDKNYQFIPPKPPKKFLELIRKSNELLKSRVNELDINKLNEDLK